MLTIKKALQEKLESAARIAIVGVGSELRGDDAAGILVIARLTAGRLKSKKRKFSFFIGATAPENLTGEIKKFKPSHIVIIDSADFKKKPGQIKFIEREDFSGASFCTHKLPLKIMIEYLAKSLGCETIVIGIQPKSLSFCSSPTKPVVTAIKQVSAALKEVIKQ
jgi:hydrogenase 3 maturation protease